jgi:hypothetical protein
MPTTYTEFTYSPMVAGKFAAICAPAIMIGSIQIRRLIVQVSGANRVRLTRHASNATGGNTPTVRPTSDGGAAAVTVVRTETPTPSITWPSSPGLVMTLPVKPDKGFAESVIDPTDGGRITITSGHSIVLEFLDDHNAEYLIGIELEEP